MTALNADALAAATAAIEKQYDDERHPRCGDQDYMAEVAIVAYLTRLADRSAMADRGRFLLCERTGALGDEATPTTCPVHGEGATCLRVYTPAERLADPRELGGSIAGPGGPGDEEGTFVIDSRRAILMDELEVVRVDTPSNDRVALLAAGRINRSENRAKVMFLGDLDMLASFITEAHALASRMGRQRDLHRLCEKRWEAIPR